MYRVIAIARYTENGQALAVYHGLEGDHGAWVRPLAMFDQYTVVDGKLVKRFTLVHKNPLESLPKYR